MQTFDNGNFDQILRHGFIEDEFDESKLKMIGQELSKSDNLNIFLRAKKFEGETT